MARIKRFASLWIIAAILFFVVGAVTSEGRAVYIALGVIFFVLAANAKRSDKTDT
jgi:hypothetical protein